MTVSQKIEIAERFLEKLLKTEPDSVERQDDLGTFLYHTKSIADYLLEEYRNKYNFDISLTDTRFKDKFAQKAKERNVNFRNNDASMFFQWYDNKIESIEDHTSVGAISKEKRNIDAHRQIVITDNLPQKIFGNNIPKDTILYVQTDQGTPPRPLPNNVIGTPELGDVDFKEGCKEYLSLMKDMVSEAHKEFPLQSPES